jgi:hypothetical protein
MLKKAANVSSMFNKPECMTNYSDLKKSQN